MFHKAATIMGEIIVDKKIENDILKDKLSEYGTPDLSFIETETKSKKIIMSNQQRHNMLREELLLKLKQIEKQTR